MTTAATIGDRIREARETRGWTLPEFGRRLRRHTGAPSPKDRILAEYESGERSPSPQTLRLLAQILDVTEAWLTSGNEGSRRTEPRPPSPEDWIRMVTRLRDLEVRLQRLESGR